MSEQQQDADTVGLTPGETLRREREKQGRTVQDVAADLRLGVHVIEAIEANRFDILGASVFARGHLRNYSVLLGLPVAQLLAQYQAIGNRPFDPDPVPTMNRTEPSIPMKPDSVTRRANRQPKIVLAAVATGALALIGLLAWYLLRPGGTEVDEASTLATEAASEPASSAAVGDSSLGQTTVPSQTQSAPQVPVQQAAGTQQPTQPTSNASIAQTVPADASSTLTQRIPRGKLRLTFAFSDESWVEVYDSRGTRRLYDVGGPGQTRSVEVDPPAQIVLGMASGVATTVNGREIQVPARRINSQVARFVVGADGNPQ